MKKTNNVETVVVQDQDPQVYEVGYHVLSTVSEADLGARVTAVRDVIESHGGSVIADEYPKFMDLAYTMVKMVANKKSSYSSSYFGWIKFEAIPKEIKAIESTLQQDPLLLRFLLVKTVRENTMVPKKVLMAKRPGDEASTKQEEKVEERPVLTEEELDKTIEELVIN